MAKIFRRKEFKALHEKLKEQNESRAQREEERKERKKLGLFDWPTANPSDSEAWIRTFEDLGLDPKDPMDWQVLIYEAVVIPYLAQLGGRPSDTWTEDRLCRLAADAALIELDNPKVPDSVICKLLVAQKGKGRPQHPSFGRRIGDYEGMKANTIRRQLPVARKTLADVTARYVRWVRQDFDVWTAAHKRELADLLVEQFAAGKHPGVLMLRLDRLIDTLRDRIGR